MRQQVAGHIVALQIQIRMVMVGVGKIVIRASCTDLLPIHPAQVIFLTA